MLDRARCLAATVGAALLLASCAGGSDTESVTLPPTEGVFDYQLGGAYDDTSIDVVVRDATAQPLEGAYSVCYVNGFQTQPDQAEAWLETSELLLDEAGSPVVDPDWPDEFILDPSTPDQREGIFEVISPVIAGCADAGFDAVEIDNLDTWTRFEGVSEDGAHALARAYVEVAHEHGLAIAQKNAAEVTRVAHEELGFDFAVTEECAVYAECAAYSDVYGEHVLQVEYPDALAEAGLTFAEVCAQPDTSPLTVLRDRDLVALGQPNYVREAC